MICKPCGNAEHQGCRGKTWCDCQHRPIKKAEPAESTPAP